MKPPFRLVPDRISHDTVEALRELLRDAEQGDVIGVAYAAMYSKRKFIVNTAGEAYRNPVFARGMISYLDDELAADGKQQ